MEYLFLLSSLIAVVILILLLVGFFKHYKNEEISKVVRLFSLLFFVYLAMAIFSLAWFFEYSFYDYVDFIYIYSVAILVQTFILFGVHNLLYGNKKLSYWLLFYLIAGFSFYISLFYLPLVVLIISFLLTLILFLNLYSKSFIFKKVSYAGILYAAISVLFTFLVFFRIGDIFVYSIVSSAIFLVFIYLFLRDVREYPIKTEKNIKIEKESGMILFLKYFIFMIVLTNLVLVATISLHEFSHVAVSRYYGCESRTIAYEAGGYPYSEIICSNLENKLPIALSGPVVPVIVALLLIFIGGRYIRPIALLAIGFNLLAGYRDYVEVGLSMNIILGISILSMILLFFGIVFLARARIEDHREFRL
jgi:hypothetical protein